MTYASRIPGYPEYFATAGGEIQSRKWGKERVLKPHRGRVNLSGNGRQDWRAVSELVALAYLGERPSPNHTVRHLDGNPHNNRPENLYWFSESDPAGYPADDERAAALRDLYRLRSWNVDRLAPLFGMTPEAVRAVVDAT